MKISDKALEDYLDTVQDENLEDYLPSHLLQEYHRWLNEMIECPHDKEGIADDCDIDVQIYARCGILWSHALEKTVKMIVRKTLYEEE